MTQFTYRRIDEQTTSGTELARILEQARDAQLSSHAGPTTPQALLSDGTPEVYAVRGTVWLREVSAERNELLVYDGEESHLILAFNPSNHEPLPLPLPGSTSFGAWRGEYLNDPDTTFVRGDVVFYPPTNLVYFRHAEGAGAETTAGGAPLLATWTPFAVYSPSGLGGGGATTFAELTDQLPADKVDANTIPGSVLVTGSIPLNKLETTVATSAQLSTEATTRSTGDSNLQGLINALTANFPVQTTNIGNLQVTEAKLAANLSTLFNSLLTGASFNSGNLVFTRRTGTPITLAIGTSGGGGGGTTMADGVVTAATFDDETKQVTLTTSTGDAVILNMPEVVTLTELTAALTTLGQTITTLEQKVDGQKIADSGISYYETRHTGKPPIIPRSLLESITVNNNTIDPTYNYLIDPVFQVPGTNPAVDWYYKGNNIPAALSALPLWRAAVATIKFTDNTYAFRMYDPFEPLETSIEAATAAAGTASNAAAEARRRADGALGGNTKVIYSRNTRISPADIPERSNVQDGQTVIASDNHLIINGLAARSGPGAWYDAPAQAVGDGQLVTCHIKTNLFPGTNTHSATFGPSSDYVLPEDIPTDIVLEDDFNAAVRSLVSKSNQHRLGLVSNGASNFAGAFTAAGEIITSTGEYRVIFGDGLPHNDATFLFEIEELDGSAADHSLITFRAVDGSNTIIPNSTALINAGAGRTIEVRFPASVAADTIRGVLISHGEQQNFRMRLLSAEITTQTEIVRLEGLIGRVDGVIFHTQVASDADVVDPEITFTTVPIIGVRNYVVGAGAGGSEVWTTTRAAKVAGMTRYVVVAWPNKIGDELSQTPPIPLDAGASEPTAGDSPVARTTLATVFNTPTVLTVGAAGNYGVWRRITLNRSLESMRGQDLILNMTHSSTPVSSITISPRISVDQLLSMIPRPASSIGVLATVNDTQRLNIGFGRGEMSGARNAFIAPIEGEPNSFMIASAVYDISSVGSVLYQGASDQTNADLITKKVTIPITNTTQGPDGDNIPQGNFYSPAIPVPANNELGITQALAGSGDIRLDRIRFNERMECSGTLRIQHSFRQEPLEATGFEIVVRRDGSFLLDAVAREVWQTAAITNSQEPVDRAIPFSKFQFEVGDELEIRFIVDDGEGGGEPILDFSGSLFIFEEEAPIATSTAGFQTGSAVIEEDSAAVSGVLVADNVAQQQTGAFVPLTGITRDNTSELKIDVSQIDQAVPPFSNNNWRLRIRNHLVPSGNADHDVPLQATFDGRATATIPHLDIGEGSNSIAIYNPSSQALNITGLPFTATRTIINAAQNYQWRKVLDVLLPQSLTQHAVSELTETLTEENTRALRLVFGTGNNLMDRGDFPDMNPAPFTNNLSSIAFRAQDPLFGYDINTRGRVLLRGSESAGFSPDADDFDVFSRIQFGSFNDEAEITHVRHTAFIFRPEGLRLQVWAEMRGVVE